MSLEQRLAPRSTVYLWATSRRYGATDRLKVIVKDLSRSGFRIRSSADYTLGDLIFVEFERGVECEAWIVRRSDGLPDYGCQFRTALTQGDVDRIAESAFRSDALSTAA